METQIKTAKELLAQIERRYFKGAGLAKASTLEGDERKAYTKGTVLFVYRSIDYHLHKN